jgi:hypothetical protein
VFEPSLEYNPQRRNLFCDLQPVTDCTAPGTFALLNKQLKSVSCPPIVNYKKKSEHIGAETETNADCDDGNGNGDDEMKNMLLIRTYMYTADGGSDQGRYNKNMGACLANAPLLFCILIACLMHGNQLIVKSGLVVVDSWAAARGKHWRYFSALAKLVYIWRDWAKAFHSTWISLFDALSAHKHALKLPSRCVAGRWGSISQTEAHFADCGHAEVKAVLLRMLCPASEMDVDDPDQLPALYDEARIFALFCVIDCTTIARCSFQSIKSDVNVRVYLLRVSIYACL